MARAEKTGTCIHDRAVMEEDIAAVVIRQDEAISLVGVEEFDGARVKCVGHRTRERNESC